MANPFTLTFGALPSEMIERPLQTGEILDAFLAEPASQRTYMITGVRGSGKTVMMTEITKRLREREDWTVIPLSPETDMIHALAAKLSHLRKFTEIFRDAKINLSFFGVSLSMDGEPPITNDETAICQMLQSIRAHGGKVLITVDEVTNSEYVRKLAGEYQIWIREDLPLFLVMTGLYENIYDLQNEKSLTFLYRAPKVHLRPLNYAAIANNYQSILQIERRDAVEMAKLTKGYAFAFQVLGYFTYREEDHDYRKVMDRYRLYLDEYVYEKLWSELSAKDQEIVVCMARSGAVEIAEIRKGVKMESNEFSKYRLRLIRKGIVDGSQRGLLSFSLPLFKEFVLDQMEFS